MVFDCLATPSAELIAGVCPDDDNGDVVGFLRKPDRIILRLIRLAYQPQANSTFLSEQTSHHRPAVLFYQNK
jgi:hypothetical protein